MEQKNIFFLWVRLVFFFFQMLSWPLLVLLLNRLDEFRSAKNCPTITLRSPYPPTFFLENPPEKQCLQDRHKDLLPARCIGADSPPRFSRRARSRSCSANVIFQDRNTTTSHLLRQLPFRKQSKRERHAAYLQTLLHEKNNRTCFFCCCSFNHYLQEKKKREKTSILLLQQTKAEPALSERRKNWHHRENRCFFFFQQEVR